MIKVHTETDKVCVAKAHEAGQSHLFDHWDDLSGEAQRLLVSDLQSINFQQVKRLLHHHRHGTAPSSDVDALLPLQADTLPTPHAPGNEPAENGGIDFDDALAAGEEALRSGIIALVTLSGGVGTGPLGEPTGLLAVGPVTGKSVFQLHAEKIRAINRRYRTSLRWTIVVHPDAFEQITTFFKKNNHFGLNASDVVFVPQPRLPLVDRRGRFVLSKPGRLALQPNGHGGIIEELFDEKGLAETKSRGTEHLFFFQVDNPLVRIADPLFIGYHLLAGSEATSKSISRDDAAEELGVFCQAGDSTGVIEYSELPEEKRRLTESDGSLAFDTGNLAVHLFRTDFFERLANENIHLPCHAVERCFPCVNRRGKIERPTEPNCFEFSCFLFDVLWLAKSSSVVSVPREDEFSPIRNTGGSHSPQSAQRDLSCLYARWLRDCGASFAGATEDALPAIEISPLYALDKNELKSKIDLPMVIGGDLHLSGG
jgi:UDP-N-acetylglucosamine/UDP-N-acetylgalactosamine diphosphorylase